MRAKPSGPKHSDREMQGVLEVKVRGLPLRALVAYAMRCARRVEPLLRLGQLRADAISAGLDVGVEFKSACRHAADASCAAWASANAVLPTTSSTPDDPYILAARAATASTETAISAVASLCTRAMIESMGSAHGADTAQTLAVRLIAETSASVTPGAADLMKLLDLNLGKPAEPGEPISWNDPRLGPVWPDGEPEWYVKAQQTCRDLEEQLRNLPIPGSPPADPLLVAQLQDWAWMDQLRNEGKLDQYRGEYVFAAEKQIFGHGRNLLKLRPPAEDEAAAKGIPPERLIDYFMPGE